MLSLIMLMLTKYLVLKCNQKKKKRREDNIRYSTFVVNTEYLTDGMGLLCLCILHMSVISFSYLYKPGIHNEIYFGSYSNIFFNTHNAATQTFSPSISYLILRIGKSMLFIMNNYIRILQCIFSIGIDHVQYHVGVHSYKILNIFEKLYRHFYYYLLQFSPQTLSVYSKNNHNDMCLYFYNNRYFLYPAYCLVGIYVFN